VGLPAGPVPPDHGAASFSAVSDLRSGPTLPRWRSARVRDPRKPPGWSYRSRPATPPTAERVWRTSG